MHIIMRELEPIPHEELQQEFQSRLRYWLNFFDNAEPDQSEAYADEVVAELDRYWEALGNNDKNFIFSGHAEWAEFEFTRNGEVVDGNSSDSETETAIKARIGDVEQQQGESMGFVVREFQKVGRPALGYLFRTEHLTTTYQGLGVQSTTLFLNLLAKDAMLMDADMFDIHSGAVDLTPDFESGDKDHTALQAARDAKALDLSIKLSSVSDWFRDYVRSPSFRWRRHDKQIAMIKELLDKIDEEIPLFGHAASIEAKQLIISPDETNPKYKIFEEEYIQIEGMCGSIIMPGLDELMKKPIRADHDMVFFAGGLCLSVLPTEPIHIPSTQEVLATNKPVYVPISSQNYSATINLD